MSNIRSGALGWRVPLAMVLIAGASIVPNAAAAQAMTPMTGQVAAFGDTFKLQVTPSNPYKHRIGVEMKVYDHQFRPVPTARVVPERFMLGAGTAREVTAHVPFGGYSPRYVRVCAESIPYRGASTQVRTRVCGKFKALQR